MVKMMWLSATVKKRLVVTASFLLMHGIRLNPNGYATNELDTIGASQKNFYMTSYERILILRILTWERLWDRTVIKLPIAMPNCARSHK